MPPHRPCEGQGVTVLFEFEANQVDFPTGWARRIWLICGTRGHRGSRHLAGATVVVFRDDGRAATLVIACEKGLDGSQGNGEGSDHAVGVGPPLPALKKPCCEAGREGRAA